MQQTVGGEAEALHTLYLAVSQFAQSFDPNVVSGSDARKILEDAGRTESVLGVIKSLALLRVDDTDAYRAAGYSSAADYGAAKTGTSRTDAQRSIKTAKRARRLPRTDEAMRRGALSREQADAITDAAAANPAAEDDLLSSAKHDDLGTLRKKAKRAKFRADPDPGARARRLHDQRSLTHWLDDDGAFCAFLKTTPDAGARLLAQLEPFRKAAFDQARKDGRHESDAAYAADALDALVDAVARPSAADAQRKGPSPTTKAEPVAGSTASESTRSPRPRPAPKDDDESRASLFDTHAAGEVDDSGLSPGPDGRAPTTGGDPPSDGDPPGGTGQDPASGSPPATRSRSAPAPVTAHLFTDLAALQRGHLEDGEICEIDGIGPIDLATARALLGDANVKLLIKQGDDIQTVVHLGRSVNARQRSALIARDPCCIVPGCGRTHGLEIDHRTGWVITETTSLDDLARLCRWHHYLKTHCGYTYIGKPGAWQWIGPDGQTVAA